MLLVVGATLALIKNGIEARSSDLKLCGHGKSNEAAIADLENSVRSWVVGLEKAGIGSLERAIRSRGLTWLPDGEAVTVEIKPIIPETGRPTSRAAPDAGDHEAQGGDDGDDRAAVGMQSLFRGAG